MPDARIGSHTLAHRRHPVLFVAVLSAALLVAGCGSGRPGTGTGTSAQSLTNPAATAYKFSACMRQHGVADFPDPRVTVKPGSAEDRHPRAPDANTVQFAAAQKACRGIMPGPSNGDLAAQAQQQRVQKQGLLSFARCVRRRGINNFPDPDAQGHLSQQMLSTAGIDVHAPSVLAAARAASRCPMVRSTRRRLRLPRMGGPEEEGAVGSGYDPWASVRSRPQCLRPAARRAALPGAAARLTFDHAQSRICFRPTTAVSWPPSSPEGWSAHSCGPAWPRRSPTLRGAGRGRSSPSTWSAHSCSATFITRLQERLPTSSYKRPFLGTGLCGALTTFSTVQLELYKMIAAHQWTLAVGYGLATVVTSFAAIAGATAMVRRCGWSYDSRDWLLVGLLGGAGAIGRFVVDGLVSERSGSGRFPGAHSSSTCPGRRCSAGWRARRSAGNAFVLSGTATIGSYTTLSTWMLETHRLGQDNQLVLAGANLVGSLLVGFAALAAGHAVGASL